MTKCLDTADTTLTRILDKGWFCPEVSVTHCFNAWSHYKLIRKPSKFNRILRNQFAVCLVREGVYLYQ
uniref:RNA-directed DNA polymerase n=1 Tax=Mesocestoides corti TaxID=53468 RepID=A0A5K3FL91_MESCO